MCLVAILGAIAGATSFLARTFQIELCRVNGANVNTPCNLGRRRKKRAFGHDEVRLWQMLEGKHCEPSFQNTIRQIIRSHI